MCHHPTTQTVAFLKSQVEIALKDRDDETTTDQMRIVHPTGKVMNDDDSLGVEVDGQLQEDKDPAEIDFLDRTEDDILHGYLPGSSYNTASMEEDGTYPQELNWSYSDVVPGTPNTNYPRYHGDGPCLRRYVDRKFDTLLGACGTAGGFSYELVKRITMNSNN